MRRNAQCGRNGLKRQQLTNHVAPKKHPTSRHVQPLLFNGSFGALYCPTVQCDTGNLRQIAGDPHMRQVIANSANRSEKRAPR